MPESLTILTGDALERLRELPDESVQMCVTSPPYWGLRDYGTAEWDGGLPECDHIQNRGVQGSTGQRANRTHTERIPYKDECGRCGAIRIDRQIGLEKTPQEFVAKIVAVFEEVRRVLKPDGTCWVNLGDSYATGAGSVGNCPGGGKQGEQWKGAATSPNRMKIPGLKPKDLCGIPWRVAFALQSNGAASPEHMHTIERMISAVTRSYDHREEWPDPIRREVEMLEREWGDAHAGGWYLRQDIIWSKPNPMPESVTDRCTKAHEYLFLLSKSQRYFYDAEAIKEPVTQSSASRLAQNVTDQPGSLRVPGKTNGTMKAVENADSRNKRSVWTIATQPFSEAHFATFPPDLIKPCILAGSRPGDVVIDPFGGSGTTGKVALELGRKALLIELNPEYVKLIDQRCNVTHGLAL